MGFLVGWFYVAFGIFLPGSLLTLGGWFVDGFLDREIGFAPGLVVLGADPRSPLPSSA